MGKRPVPIGASSEQPAPRRWSGRRAARRRLSAYLAIALSSCVGSVACSGAVGADDSAAANDAPSLPPGTTLDPETGVVTDQFGNVVGVADEDGTLRDATTGAVIGSTQPSGSSVSPSGSVAPAVSSSGSPALPGGDEDTVLVYTAPPAEPPELRARTWRLTHEQYQRSVFELVGVEPSLEDFAPESGNGIYANFSSTNFVRVDLADNYFDAAKDVATSLSVEQLSRLTSCDLSASCAADFIDALGARAFRRPLTDEEGVRYEALFETGSAQGDVVAGYRAIVQGMLNSPNFLYRTEMGGPEAETQPTLQMTDYEVASLLSYSLLGGPPPDALLTAAASGELTNAATLPAHVAAIVQSPEASGQLQAFLLEWLEVNHFDQVEKFEDSFAGFDRIKPAMADETEQFLAATGTTESSFSALLLDSVPSVDAQLDAFYLSDPSAPVASSRTGVLSLGSVLANHAKPYLTSPTLRGNFVRKRFFCQEITLPVGFTPPPLSETEQLGVARTTRELYQRHQTDPSCAGCHRLTDNIGFVMEAFDGAGRSRTVDTTQGDSQPIDTNAVLTDSDVNRPISTLGDLSQALAESELVRECMARQAYRYYFGQGEASRGQLPIVDAHAALRQSGRLGDMLTALFSSASTYSRQR